jgi:hypothetical protein
MLIDFILTSLALTVIFSGSLSILLSLQIITDLFDPDRRKYMIDGMWIKRRFSKYEHCVGCKELTNVRKDLDISLRHHYIEGSGQLCYECYMLAYPKEPQIVVPAYD